MNSTPRPPSPVNNIPVPTQEEEDAIIHSRITNDERGLRRLLKKFNTFSNLAFPPSVSCTLPTSNTPTTVSESMDAARDSFLMELAAFSLQLKKAAMVCEAEARQVEEYERERQRIEEERVALKRHIEQLKTSLEEAQVERRRKLEYDVFAEKINSLPSRDELERTIQLLENDMSAVRAEHEVQRLAIQTHRQTFKSIMGNLRELQIASRSTSDTPRDATPSGPGDLEPPSSPLTNPEDDREEGEEGGMSSAATTLVDPHADALASSVSVPAVRNLRASRGIASAPVSSAPSPAPPTSALDYDDIEMGELAEPSRGKKPEEELEEGEASDLSSELSDPPDN